MARSLPPTIARGFARVAAGRDGAPGGSTLPQPFFTDRLTTLYRADCLEVLAAMPPASADLVVVDPPWNLGLEYGRHDDGMTDADYREWLHRVLTSCGRMARGSVVLLPGWHNLIRLAEMLPSAELVPDACSTWRCRHRAPTATEPLIILRAEAGFRRSPLRLAGLIADADDPGDASCHPCPKPVELMAQLVGRWAPDGGLVFDPFSGAGSTLVAARLLQQPAIGVELEGRFCATAARRIERLAPAANARRS